MSGKLKSLLVVLSLGALALPVYLFGLFRGADRVTDLADPTLLKAQSLGLIEPSRDTDSDGLTDNEEIYWGTDFQNKDSDGDGFLDGEEVLSGHDPAKKGPEDWLDRSKNITQNMEKLLVGGIYAGALKPGGDQYDAAIQSLAESIAEQYRENIAITVDDIELTPTNTLKDRADYVLKMMDALTTVVVPAAQDAEKFLSTVSDVPLDDPRVLTEHTKRLAAFATAARNLSRTSGERAIRVAAIPVPLPFAPQHKGLLRILRNLQRQYELAATIKSDPIQGTVALRAIVNMHANNFPAFLADFAEQVRLNLTDAH